MKPPFTEDFKKAYNKYRKDNPKQKLPEYTLKIGVLFNELLNHICSIAYQKTGTFDELAVDNYKVREFLGKATSKKIIFHDGNHKPQILTITNSILIHLIEKYACKITSSPLMEPKNPTKNLTLLLKLSYTVISTLKLKGITDDLLVEFITNSVTHAPKGSLWTNTSFTKKTSNPKASVIQIISVEAFNKSFQRVRVAMETHPR